MHPSLISPVLLPNDEWSMSYDSINSAPTHEPSVLLRGPQFQGQDDVLIHHPNSRPASVGSINDRPLFGESRRVSYRNMRRHLFSNSFIPILMYLYLCLFSFFIYNEWQEKLLSTGLILAIVLLLGITIITLVLIQFKFVNFLALSVIISLAASHILLIYWHRQGDLDPRFRTKLFWDSVNLCLFCVVVILYYFELNKS